MLPHGACIHIVRETLHDLELAKEWENEVVLLKRLTYTYLEYYEGKTFHVFYPCLRLMPMLHGFICFINQNTSLKHDKSYTECNYHVINLVACFHRKFIHRLTNFDA